MDFNEIKALIEAVNSSEISYFELTMNDAHIKMDKSLKREISNEKNVGEVLSSKACDIDDKGICATVETKEKFQINKDIEVNSINDKCTIIKSPMVGTFYSAASEDSENFVNVGDKVKKGSVLCIIEAMKLMNEIESDYKGTVKEILVKNGDMVEYGQPIFKIEED